MLDSIYIGMGGLLNFSKGLSNISNNVANLNTPGFKGSQLEFQDLLYRHAYSGSGDRQATPYTQGSGAKTGATSVRFTQGEFRQTENPLHAAIDGNGFFVARKDGNTFYTRDGQFSFDDEDFLVSSDGARIAGMTGGTLTDISLSGQRSNPAKATTSVAFENSLSIDGVTHSVTRITVFDSLGVAHAMTLELKNNKAVTSNSWTFTLKEGTTAITSGEVRYSTSGVPEAGFETTTFAFSPATGGGSTRVTLDFSKTTLSSSTPPSATSNLSIDEQDGYAAGFLTKTAIDKDGFIVLTYSNGQTVQDQRLALAWFNDLSVLKSEGSNFYSQFGDAERILGSPGEGPLGPLQLQGIELSNVELAQEFGDLIIVQRGYQASSQIITAANEMIQQLGELNGKR